MGHTFHATPSEAIIYENSDDAPRSDPFGYRSRVVFYSGFRYPARVGQLTGTATFAAVDRAADYPIVIQAYNCGAHGRPGIPLVEGRWIGIGNNGADVPMVGSVPIFPRIGAITSVQRASNVVTITTAAAHEYTSGRTVTVNATTNTSVNGTFTIQSVPTATTFRYNQSASNIPAASDTGTTFLDTNLMRWGTLGADATNVYLYSMCFQFPTTTSFVHPQCSVSYVIDILDWTLT